MLFKWMKQEIPPTWPWSPIVSARSCFAQNFSQSDRYTYGCQHSTIISLTRQDPVRIYRHYHLFEVICRPRDWVWALPSPLYLPFHLFGWQILCHGKLFFVFSAFCWLTKHWEPLDFRHVLSCTTERPCPTSSNHLSFSERFSYSLLCESYSLV